MLKHFGMTRRQFLSNTAAAGVVGGLSACETAAPPQPPPGEQAAPFVKPRAAALRWLEGRDRNRLMGATCGVPWPEGQVQADAPFRITASNGQGVASQSWPIAYWPDGSIKWSAHAVVPDAERAGGLTVQPGKDDATPRSQPILTEETDRTIRIDTGVMRCDLVKRGTVLIPSIQRNGQDTLRNGRLVLLNQDGPSDTDDPNTQTTTQTFTGEIASVTLEQRGPVRAVVKIEGKHSDSDRAWLPFVVRLYFYAGSDHVRIMHTIIFDGDEKKDFIRGLGMRFDVPMRDEQYDRHMRLVSSEGGLWAEAVRPITGQRRNPGWDVQRKQVNGEKLPAPSHWESTVAELREYIPTWGDVTLSQLSADGFEIHKRTRPGQSWVFSDGAQHAAGVGYVGGASGGGVVFGLRDFWQSHPTQLDIRNAASDTASVTLWMWSPKAPAMDLRFYHDGMGIEGHKEELRALNITYEDYEPGFGTPEGVARTSEMNLWLTDKTPSNRSILDFADEVTTPPMLACWPQHYVQCGVFGGLFDLPDRSTPMKKALEQTLDDAFDSYLTQREQRRWYGFWNYGDVMHSYDPARHVWRYDVGGYAWDNSELSPDFWLWYSYLRTGRGDIFRFAEAMCRHTGEVDVHHLGRFKDLGSRHNVMHWGCSAKQVRISSCAYRRFFYYLTADERTGDLLWEQEDNAKAFLNLDPYRKIRKGDYKPKPDAVAVRVGLDWSGIAHATLTAYERTGEDKYKQRLLNSMQSIGKMPYGFFTAGTILNPETHAFVKWDNDVELLHLSAVFGLNEVCAELVQNFDVPEFERAWLDYCEYYNADPSQRKAALGVDAARGALVNGHSRLTAFAAVHRDKPELAQRAWRELLGADKEQFGNRRFTPVNKRIEAGPESLKAVNETNWMSTNDIGMWGTAVIQNLALIADQLPKSVPNDT